MMDQKEHLQRCLLDIAIDINDLCDNHNIQYSMDGGTLLGAIRHKGFIPWDDDLDIAMKRSQYNRFLEVCSENLDKEKYYIQNNEMYYAFCFSKVQLNGTEIVEDFSKNVKIRHGIFVDVFPYDNVPDNAIKRKVFLFLNTLLKNMIWAKCGYGTDEQRKTIRYKIYKLIGLFSSLDKLKSCRLKHLTKYNGYKTQYCFTGDYPKNLIKNCWFENLTKIRFESTSLSGFSQYDDFLKTLYGNYMELPPEEERIVHSQYKINFGKY